MNQAILQIENLRRVFQVGSEEVHALKGVSFSINKGEFVSIMGSSGSGKSTMLNILGCLDTPTSGEYLIDGVSVRERSKNDLADIRNRILRINRKAYNRMWDLANGSTQMILEYQRMYHDFRIVIV